MAEEKKDAVIDSSGMDDFLAVPEVKTEGETETKETPSQEEKKEDSKESGEADQKESTEEEKKGDEIKDDEKVETKDEKESPKTDWDSEENPYKKRHGDTFKWANTVNQQNVDLKKTIDRLEKKVDGTYDPEVDKGNEPTPEQIKAEGDLRGRVKASDVMAYDKYGKDETESFLNEFNEKFGNDQGIQYRVLASDAPTMEAIKIVKEAKFFDAYGRDPDAIKSKMREEIEAEIRDDVVKDEKKKFAERMSNKEKGVQGVSDARSSSEKEKGRPSVEPLSEVFSG